MGAPAPSGSGASLLGVDGCKGREFLCSVFGGENLTFPLSLIDKQQSATLNMDDFMVELPSPQEMERAYRTRDTSYDGIFFLAVRSTGIFCRPSCPARKPDPRNVTYYPSAREAIFAGFRPCKRCQPMSSNGAHTNLDFRTARPRRKGYSRSVL